MSKHRKNWIFWATVAGLAIAGLVYLYSSTAWIAPYMSCVYGVHVQTTDQGELQIRDE